MTFTAWLFIALIILVLIANFSNRSVRGWIIAVAVTLGIVIGVRFILFSLKVVLTLTQWLFIVIVIAAVVFALYGWYISRQPKRQSDQSEK